MPRVRAEFLSPHKDEWNDYRPVRGFPNYMIRVDGEVRNFRTGRAIRPTHTYGAPYVRLFRDGHSYTRGVNKLVRIAFPIIDATQVLDDWVAIPGFEMYEINRYGRIRRASTQRELKIQDNSGRYVNLSKNGRTYRPSIGSLMRLVGYA